MFTFSGVRGNWTPHSNPDSGQCTMEINTRFVVKPESGQQCIFDYFWLNQWWSNGNWGGGVERHQRGGIGGVNPFNPRQIEQGWKLKMSNVLHVSVANAIFQFVDSFSVFNRIEREWATLNLAIQNMWDRGSFSESLSGIYEILDTPLQLTCINNPPSYF